MSQIAGITDTLKPRVQHRWVFILTTILAVFAVALSAFGWQQSVLFLIGMLFGLTLYHASFGFSSSYRKLFVHQDIRGVLAQILMLAVATVLFAPVLLAGAATGAIAPVAVQAAIGAFLFGVGMQLGSGCACGTLYTIGGGSSMMLLTLSTFGFGSFVGTLTDSLWSGLPKIDGISLTQAWGWMGVFVQIAVLIGLAIILYQWKKADVELSWHSISFRSLSPRSFLYGPWSLVAGAIVLALLNWLTLLIAGRPWGVTWGFTLWTAKIAHGLGWNPESSLFWSQEAIATVLNANVFSDVTSVMNFGIVLGAALAAALSGHLSVRKPPSRMAIIAALIGGLLMGYGAWLAFGCNVGAYFSGIASTSLHGWLWIVFALLGTGLGVKLRSQFGLSN